MASLQDIVLASLMGAGEGIFKGLSEKRRFERAEKSRTAAKQFDAQQAALNAIVNIGLQGSDPGLREFSGQRLGQQAGIEGFQLPQLSEIEILSRETKDLSPEIRKRVFEQRGLIDPDQGEQAKLNLLREQTAGAQERTLLTRERRNLVKSQAEKLKSGKNRDLNSTIKSLQQQAKLYVDDLGEVIPEFQEDFEHVQELIRELTSEQLKRKGVVLPETLPRTGGKREFKFK